MGMRKSHICCPTRKPSYHNTIAENAISHGTKQPRVHHAHSGRLIKLKAVHDTRLGLSATTLGFLARHQGIDPSFAAFCRETKPPQESRSNRRNACPRATSGSRSIHFTQWVHGDPEDERFKAAQKATSLNKQTSTASSTLRTR